MLPDAPPRTSGRGIPLHADHIHDRPQTVFCDSLSPSLGLFREISMFSEGGGEAVMLSEMFASSLNVYSVAEKLTTIPVCMYMCVCMYVCMYMCVCMYVCMYVCM